MPTIRNFTPHPIHLLDGQDQVLQSFPSEGTLRVTSAPAPLRGLADYLGVPCVALMFGEPDPVPPCEYGDAFIVSRIYAEALKARRRGVSEYTLLVPAEVVRDAAGQIIGCRSFEVV